MSPQKIILAGGTGFLGNILIRHWQRLPIEIIVLSRTPQTAQPNVRYVEWDGRTKGSWINDLNGADVIINLAGRSVDCRYNKRNRQAIVSSRIDSTTVLGEAIQTISQPPKLWINLASATIYRHTIDRVMDEETGIIGEEIEDYQFSVDVCKRWEATFWQTNAGATRKVALRTGIVLGKQGGVFPVFRRLAQLGLGGKMGSGQQFISWLHEHDFARIIDFIIGNDSLSGAYNATAPNPTRNSTFMSLLRKALHIPVGIPATEWMITIGAFLLRTEPELILKSRNVRPANLAQAGFQFQYPILEQAICELIN